MAGLRLVLKVGTNVLTQANQKLDYNVIHQIVDQIGALRRERHRIVLVTSGAVGAAYGLADFAGEKSRLLQRQMKSALGQPRLMQLYADFFREHNVTVAQCLLTRSDFADRERYLNVRNVVEGLLQRGVLPVVNENDVVASEALTFGDNDYLSAAVASMIGAERLFLLTTVDGFYAGGDPKTTPGARLLPEVTEITPQMWESCQTNLSSGGSGGMLSKLKAVEMATSFGIGAHILSGKEPEAVARVLAGEVLGTHFPPTQKRLKSYRQWLRFGALTSGRITVDAGAVRALRNDKSLLPAGITRVEGGFHEGDIVEIFTAEGEKLGVGLVNFSADTLREIVDKGQAAPRSQEAVHKDRLLLV